LLKTLRAPPPPGSLQESALILLLMKLESVEHARFRALAQIQLDPESGIKAFEEYMKIAFPYLEASKQRDKTDHMKLLASEVARGPLTVTAVAETTGRSKLKTRMAKRTAPQSKQEAEKLYQKLGSTIPTHEPRSDKT